MLHYGLFSCGRGVRLINIKQMEYLLELARTQSFSAAAQKLGISQPTMTQALQKIESNLGVPLFEREGRELRLTEYGTIFLEAGSIISELYADAVKKIDDLRYGRSGTIRLHIAPSRAPFTLPDALVRFQARYPQVCVEISERLTSNIKKNVLSGTADLGVLVTQQTQMPELQCVPLERETILVAAHTSLLPSSLRAAAPERCSDAAPSLFADVPFVLLGEDQMLVSQFRSFCERQGLEIRCVARCRNVETSLSLANAGLGATLVTSAGMDYYRSSFPGLRYFDVANGALDRSVCLIYRKNRFLNEAQQYLIKSITEKE